MLHPFAEKTGQNGNTPEELHRSLLVAQESFISKVTSTVEWIERLPTTEE